MSYDDRLAARVRALLSEESDVVEKKMFGGLCFMVNGAMCCGLTATDFMVRVGPERFDEALGDPHALLWDLTGCASKGMVSVTAEGLRTEAMPKTWVSRGVAFVKATPKAKARTKRSTKR